MLSKMCLWIGGIYKFMGLSLSFKSIIYQWPESPGNLQWVEGPIVRDLSAKGLVPEITNLSAAYGMRQVADGRGHALPSALECSQTVRYPYALFRGAGAPEMVGGMTRVKDGSP
jgi:hypothetical protein